MSYGYYLVGLNTLELISLGNEKSVAKNWGIWDHQGPILDLHLLGYGRDTKKVMLPKSLLERLYTRFAEANPKGASIAFGQSYLAYAPPELTEDERIHLQLEGKLFPVITMDINYSRLGDPDRIPRLCQYLPELLEPATLTALACDPEIDLGLMSKARAEGALSPIYGPRHWRWSPEWAAYVEAYRKTPSAASD
jgi:hypothetical protein